MAVLLLTALTALTALAAGPGAVPAPAAARAGGTGTTLAASPLSPGTRPAGARGRGDAIFGRLNDDRYPDEAYLGTVGSTLCSVIVQYGTPDGGFGYPVAYVYLRPGLDGGGAVNCPDIGVAVDLNRDRIDELVVGWFAGPPRAAPFPLLVLASGTFQPTRTLSTATFEPSWMGVAELNGDGHPDLYLLNDQGDGYETYLAGGADVLTRGPERWCATPEQLDLRDFDADGAQDVLVSYILECADESSGVVVLLDDGTFQRLHRDPTGAATWLASIVDANGDGHPDVRTVETATGAATWFINTHNGRFAAAPTAVDDQFRVPEHGSTGLDVLGNDLVTTATRIDLVRPPRYGTARVTSGRTVTYVPRPQHESSDSFVYRLTLDGRTSEAKVSLRITG
ncbi:hypothetical protein CIK06_23150 [Plantactinospora sp. KBS50]|nr:hypothetical protein CIK06_23150 [Plantactinospora sp. KBS50]